jgi:hypothetical protein
MVCTAIIRLISWKLSRGSETRITKHSKSLWFGHEIYMRARFVVSNCWVDMTRVTQIPRQGISSAGVLKSLTGLTKKNRDTLSNFLGFCISLQQCASR